jgi:hypothetical protein
MDDMEKQGKKSAILSIINDFVKPEKSRRKKSKLGIVKEEHPESLKDESVSCEGDMDDSGDEKSVLKAILEKLLAD